MLAVASKVAYVQKSMQPNIIHTQTHTHMHMYIFVFAICTAKVV